MTVSALSDRHHADSANPVPRIELRRGGRARAGSYLYEGDKLLTGWHSHDMHQIEYAIGGVVEVQTPAGHYLLPPQQIWSNLIHGSLTPNQARFIGIGSLVFTAELMFARHLF